MTEITEAMVAQTLVEARDLIKIPEHWTQGEYRKVTRWSPDVEYAYCALGAVREAARRSHAKMFYRLVWECENRLRRSVGERNIVWWNDTAGRAHSEVKAAFNRAIEAAS